MPEPSGDKYVFDWQELAFVQPVAPDLLDRSLPPGVTNVTSEVSRDFLTDMVYIKLKAYVLTHQLTEHSVSRSRTVEWPASPWQTTLPPFPQLGKPNRVVLSDVRWTAESQSDDPQVSAEDAPWMRRPGDGK